MARKFAAYSATSAGDGAASARSGPNVGGRFGLGVEGWPEKDGAAGSGNGASWNEKGEFEFKFLNSS